MNERSDTGEIVIYQTDDGQTLLEVSLVKDTVWLSLNQMVLLFDRDKSVISRHIRNIFKERELEKKSTVAKNATVQIEGDREITRNIDFYNLDMIISVGYRVNSLRGTQFRIWANKILKEYLVTGYALNEKRLQAQIEKYEALKQSIRLIENITDRKLLSTTESEGLLKVIGDFNYALDTLDRYDYGKLELGGTSDRTVQQITYKEAKKAIKTMRGRFSDSTLFGQEKDNSFSSSLDTIYQTFDGKDLYPSIEEKAAHLLYFIVKNHSFVDGNKRIAAAIFTWFLERNGLLYRPDGVKRIADNALVALTLMIAMSDPKEKDVITTIIVNLINKDN
ncbi:MAG: virulence protein RhuM/Fic/DOC family protein [Deltaproteobacteria bacterium]|nr:virulence protein RhuM/Fic/DOC family protein [Deltaproteobacteria bacterium]